MKHFRKAMIMFAAFVIGLFGFGSLFDSEIGKLDFSMVWFIVWMVVISVDTLTYICKGEKR